MIQVREGCQVFFNSSMTYAKKQHSPQQMILIVKRLYMDKETETMMTDLGSKYGEGLIYEKIPLSNLWHMGASHAQCKSVQQEIGVEEEIEAHGR